MILWSVFGVEATKLNLLDLFDSVAIRSSTSYITQSPPRLDHACKRLIVGWFFHRRPKYLQFGDDTVPLSVAWWAIRKAVEKRFGDANSTSVPDLERVEVGYMFQTLDKFVIAHSGVDASQNKPFERAR
jgi:hypothetical protein